MKALLSTTYFGPVQWYQKLRRYDEAEIEQWESFQKQTYRNRCIIATANGPLALTVPVVHSSEFRVQSCDAPHKSQLSNLNSQTLKDIRISDHGNWRHLHWNALQTAYGDSPFFEYYQDDLRPFFERRWDYLLDFNEAIRQKMCELLDITPTVTYSRQFSPPSSLLPPPSSPITDFRTAITPKHPKPDPDFTSRPYYQVYQQKHGFLPNLSIVDLLFNMGPEAIFWL